MLSFFWDCQWRFPQTVHQSSAKRDIAPPYKCVHNLFLQVLKSVHKQLHGSAVSMAQALSQTPRCQCRHIRLSLLQLWTATVVHGSLQVKWSELLYFSRKINPNWSAELKAFPGLLSAFLPYQNLQKTTEIWSKDHWNPLRLNRAWRTLFYEQSYLVEGLISMHGIFLP